MNEKRNTNTDGGSEGSPMLRQLDSVAQRRQQDAIDSRGNSATTLKRNEQAIQNDIVSPQNQDNADSLVHPSSSKARPAGQNPRKDPHNQHKNSNENNLNSSSIDLPSNSQSKRSGTFKLGSASRASNKNQADGPHQEVGQ